MPGRGVTLTVLVVSTLRYLPISTLDSIPWIIISGCVDGSLGANPKKSLNSRGVIGNFMRAKNGLSEVVQLHIRPILISITLDQSQSSM